MNINSLSFLFCSLVCLFFGLCFSSCGPRTNNGKQSVDSVLVVDSGMHFEYGICVDSLEVTHYSIQQGEHLSSIFANLGFSATESAEITDSLSPFYPPSKLQVGNTYATLTLRDSSSLIKYIVFEKSPVDFVIVDLADGKVKVHDYAKPVSIKREYAEGVISSSMWNDMIDAGAPALLALKLSDIFAWQIDFFDVKKGDSFRLMYDVAYIDDTTMVEISSIEGAVFTHQGKQFQAIPFQQDSVIEFFDENGNSLRKAFLKAPLDFFRITSRFSNSRYHPILKRHRAHHGVDYAAPVGTPVKTIGDGVVIAKGYQRNGAGNFLKIKHNATYTTTYMHLSRFAKGIEKGRHVKQGEIVAYVGSTGLSTGPHLDFRVHKNNQPINPLSMESPPSLPVREELRDSFMRVKEKVIFELDSFKMNNNTFANQKNDSTILIKPSSIDLSLL